MDWKNEEVEKKKKKKKKKIEKSIQRLKMSVNTFIYNVCRTNFGTDPGFSSLSMTVLWTF